MVYASNVNKILGIIQFQNYAKNVEKEVFIIQHLKNVRYKLNNQHALTVLFIIKKERLVNVQFKLHFIMESNACLVIYQNIGTLELYNVFLVL